MSKRAAWVAGLLSALVGGIPLHAAGPADYLRDVKPILSARCYACHGAVRQKGGLRLDTAELLRQGGDSGPAVTAGKSAESLLVARVTGAGGVKRMPPAKDGAPLTPTEI